MSLIMIAAKFAHRRNNDGTFDAICSKCFKTVCYAESSAELIEAERNHICETPLLVVKENE
jgi:hypothetical protein